MEVYIFGAQGIALGACRAIKGLFPHYCLTGFLVTDMCNNPGVLEGLPVYELTERRNSLSDNQKNSILIYICTPENIMDEIKNNLRDAGFTNIVPMTSLRWAKLQEYAFLLERRFMPLSAYPPGPEKASLQVFKAKFFKDKNLNTVFSYPDYFRDLQVGASNTEIRVAELTDNSGDDHISWRNGNYSELTGLYWIWKNYLNSNDSEGKYVGLAHYRRFLELSEDDLHRLETNDVDVVLPYPMPYVPSVEAHPNRYLTEAEWKAVWRALEELHPEGCADFQNYLQQGYMYNYNIVLAKREVLKHYCEWLFPILFRVEDLVEHEGLNEPHRYIGYIGETLESFYFMVNKQEYKITHAGCHFLT